MKLQTEGVGATGRTWTYDRQSGVLHSVTHPQRSYRRLSDNDFGVSQTGPDDLHKALHMHIEDSRGILCHLTQDEHCSIAPVALALPS